MATALWLVALLGLGTLFLSRTTEYSQRVYALLFGEVLGISPNEIMSVAAINALSIGAVSAPPLLFLGILVLATATALPWLVPCWSSA